MLKRDQIQIELKAIEDFDALFMAAHEHCPADVIGFELRKIRTQELLAFAELLNSSERTR